MPFLLYGARIAQSSPMTTKKMAGDFAITPGSAWNATGFAVAEKEKTMVKALITAMISIAVVVVSYLKEMQIQMDGERKDDAEQV